MAHTFDIWTESTASVEQIHAAFGREDYWTARLAGDAVGTLDSLTADSDGTVSVQVTQHVGRQLLPGLVAKVLPGDLRLVHIETWRADADGNLRGETRILAGGLGSSHAANWLAPADRGSRMRSAVKVEVKVPLVGGKLEKSIGAGLAENIPEIVRFTTAWIAEHE
jgi:hypothetical protein